MAFFPLNGQYETTDISHSSNLPGEAHDVELAPGPDGSAGSSYQFSGNLTSFIKFLNNGGLDTRYSMTFLAWIYHEQSKGPIFWYSGPGQGLRILLQTNDDFVTRLVSSNHTLMEFVNTFPLKPKTWHFVGSSYNYVDREVILWLNGSLYRKKAVAWPTELGTQKSVFMGALPSVGAYKGRISCAQLYDRVLTELEIEDAKQSCFTTGKTAESSLFCIVRIYCFLNLIPHED